MGTNIKQTLIARSWVLRSSRKYFAFSLLSWKNADAQRVAAQLVQPYARAYATRLAAVARNDEPIVTLTQAQLGQYRWGLGPQAEGVGEREGLCPETASD